MNLGGCMTTSEITDFVNQFSQMNKFISCNKYLPRQKSHDSDSDNNIDDTNIIYNDVFNDIEKNDKTCIFYYNNDEIYDEKVANDYHYLKAFGNWQYAKMIVSHSNNVLCTDFIWDYLDILFQQNYDDFNNITKVYYKNNLDIGIVYEFEPVVAKFLVENLKIQPYKSKNYLFSNDENINKWDFKITIITTKGIYAANRYINESTIGFY